MATKKYKAVGWVVKVRQAIDDPYSAWVIYNYTDRPTEEFAIAAYDDDWGNWHKLIETDNVRCVRVYEEDE